MAVLVLSATLNTKWRALLVAIPQLSLLTLYIILQLQFYSFSVRLLELRGQLGGGAHYQHAVAKVKSNRTQHKYV